MYASPIVVAWSHGQRDGQWGLGHQHLFWVNRVKNHLQGSPFLSLSMDVCVQQTYGCQDRIVAMDFDAFRHLCDAVVVGTLSCRITKLVLHIQDSSEESRQYLYERGCLYSVTDNALRLFPS